MDNSVDQNNYFQNYTARELWTKCIAITRIVYRIEKNAEYAQANITVVGITRAADGRPQYILVNADGGNNKKLKFPGL